MCVPNKNGCHQMREPCVIDVNMIKYTVFMMIVDLF